MPSPSFAVMSESFSVESYKLTFFSIARAMISSPVLPVESINERITSSNWLKAGVKAAFMFEAVFSN